MIDYGRSLSKAIIIILIVTLLIDVSIIRLSDLFPRQSNPAWKLAVFISEIVTIGASQLLLLNLAGREKDQFIMMRKKGRILKAMLVSSSILTALLFIIVFQMVMNQEYSTLLFLIILIVSYLQAVIMITILAQKFFSWYSSKHDTVVLLYGISSLVLCANLLLGISLVALSVVFKPPVVIPHIGTVYITFSTGSMIGTINNAYIFTSVASFVTLWIATCLLLEYHSQKLGKFRFWLLACVPLVYFLSQFLSIFFNFYGILVKTDPIFFSGLFTLLNTYSKPAGGILFGMAFLTTASKIQRDKPVRYYLIISAAAIMFFFISNQPIIILSTPYPPFGLPSVSFVGFTSFLLLMGIYYSAASASIDAQLRRSIKNVALKESRLLRDIGSAELETRIIRTAQQAGGNVDRQTREIESSYGEEDLHKYVKEVLAELTKQG